MFYVYILKSIKDSRYYTGYTHNLAQRLYAHNNGSVKATRKRGPWEIFYTEKFLEEAGAIRREQQIKKWKSRKAIERLKFGNKIEDPRFVSRALRGTNRETLNLPRAFETRSSASPNLHNKG